MTMGRLFRFLKNSSGTAAVEMMLMMPIVIVLIFTTAEGGNFMYLQHKVTKGVRDGARYAARLPFSYYNCGTNTIADPAGVATPLADIKNLTRTGYISGDNPNVGGTDNPVFHGWTSANITVTMSCDTDAGHTYVNKGIYTNTGGVPRIKVSALVNYPSLFSILGFDFASIAKLNAASQAAVMGI